MYFPTLRKLRGLNASKQTGDQDMHWSCIAGVMRALASKISKNPQSVAKKPLFQYTGCLQCIKKSEKTSKNRSKIAPDP